MCLLHLPNCYVAPSSRLRIWFFVIDACNAIYTKLWGSLSIPNLTHVKAILRWRCHPAVSNKRRSSATQISTSSTVLTKNL